jgi:hypothetical protein
MVRLLSNRSTRWWFSFRGEGAKVEMEIARQHHPGSAVLLQGDSEALREGCIGLSAPYPGTPKLHGLELDAGGEIVGNSLAEIAEQLV